MFSHKRSTRAPELPSKLDVEVREEIRFYLEMRARELMAEGRDAEEAWRLAIAAFGQPEAVAEECVAVRSPEAPRAVVGRSLRGLGQDVRHALRGLWKAPGFSLVAVLTLAIGIGANTAIFSAVSGVLLHPLPFDDPEELVAINSRWTPESGYDWPKYPVGSPEYFDYLSQNHTMAHVGAVSTEAVTLTSGTGEPEIVTGAAVSASVFSVLGTPPLLGRVLLTEDDGAEPRPLFVLSYDLWQRRFGGDSSVIGQMLTTGTGVEYQAAGEIVGVMPQGFAFPAPDVQIWTHLRLDPARTWRGGHWFSMVARLAPGVTFEEADAEMKTLMEGWALEYPDHHVGHFLYVTPLLEDIVGNVRPALLLVFGAVGFVLLVACANVANLLLARGESRRREIAVRRALGAGRGRLVRHLLVESVLLAAAGGALGVLLAKVGVGALLALDGGTIPRVETIGVDWRVLAFVGVVVLLTSLVFGMLPALHAASPNLSDAFKDGGAVSGGPRRQHFRRMLTVSEIALAVLLVIGAALMTKSFWTLVRQDPGIRTDGLLYTRLSLPSGRYSPEEAAIFYARLVEAAKGLPRVGSVSLVDRPPLLEGRARTRFDMLEDEESFDGAGHTASSIMAGAGLFETLGIPLRRGRLLTEDDRVGTEHVVVVDEVLARRYWPGEDAIGKQIRFARTDGPFHHVVGIVGNVKFEELGAANPTFYYAYEQIADWMWFRAGTMTLVIRAEGDPLVQAQPVRNLVRDLDPDLPIVWMRTQDDLVASSVARPRFMMTLLGVFSGVALVLAAVGVYGVMSHGVAQRTGEVGIRVALGARSRDVVRLVVRQGMALALVGVVIGLAAALAATRVLTGFLFEVSPTDPWTFAGVAFLVGAVAWLACYIPARRASRVDPMVALRAE